MEVQKGHTYLVDHSRIYEKGCLRTHLVDGSRIYWQRSRSHSSTVRTFVENGHTLSSNGCWITGHADSQLFPFPPRGVHKKILEVVGRSYHRHLVFRCRPRGYLKFAEVTYIFKLKSLEGHKGFPFTPWEVHQNSGDHPSVIMPASRIFKIHWGYIIKLKSPGGRKGFRFHLKEYINKSRGLPPKSS